MSGRWWHLAPLAAVLLAAGCDAVVGGAAKPAPNQLPHPVIGETVRQVPLDDAALSKLLGRSFQAVSQFPPAFGGAEMLDDAYPDVSPTECLGVVYMTQKSVYQSAAVTNIATEIWQQEGDTPSAADIAEGVVALPTRTDADALLAKFTEQWRHCDGKTVSVPASSFAQNVVTNVRVADSVVAANISKNPDAQSVLHAVPEVRALGVRGNCLVEVEVAYVGGGELSEQSPAKAEAVTIAHAMMDKVSALS
jgi:hypothetical protein